LLRQLLLAGRRAVCRGLSGSLLPCAAARDRARRRADRRAGACVARDRADRRTAGRSTRGPTDRRTSRRGIGFRLRRPRRGIQVRLECRGIDPRLLFGPAPALLLVEQLLVLRLVVAWERVKTQLIRG